MLMLVLEGAEKEWGTYYESRISTVASWFITAFIIFPSCISLSVPGRSKARGSVPVALIAHYVTPVEVAVVFSVG